MSTNSLLLSSRFARTVGVGILSWKSEQTLRSTLRSHAEKGLFNLFDRALIHFQEFRPQDEDLAREFRVDWVGSEKNRHIGGGFYKLIRELDTDYVFLLEDDLTVDKSADDLYEALSDGIHLMESDEIDLLQCRRRGNLQRTYTKFWRIHEFDTEVNDFPADRFYRVSAPGRVIKRLQRPFDADRMMGKAPWVERRPERVFPRQIRRVPALYHDVFVLTGRATKWSNPAILAPRNVLLEIYEYICDQTPGFEDFGLSLEKLINKRHRQWWLTAGYRVGVTKQILIDHDRKTDGGKLNEEYLRVE